MTVLFSSFIGDAEFHRENTNRERPTVNLTFYSLRTERDRWGEKDLVVNLANFTGKTDPEVAPTSKVAATEIISENFGMSVLLLWHSAWNKSSCI